MFEGFETKIINTGDAQIHLRTGGIGPPLLLLHGFPQTHVHWHSIAPLLRNHFTLVMPDLRGYGDSTGPLPDPDHLGYSKRVMAEDMVAVMTKLGFSQFSLAGHDRGARVAYRLTLDQPDRVARLISLDTIPTLDVWEAMDSDAAIEAFHWPLLAQPTPIPEKLMGHDSGFLLRYLLDRWAGGQDALNLDARTHYENQFHRPPVLTAMAEDYRAGATIDVLHDRQDREANRQIKCPMQVLRGTRYTSTSLLPIWRRWAGDVREIDIDCGHFIAEEASQPCANALKQFLLG